ncbi:unnamed protein product [Amoebophrya sp. A25]|nr:unnamed protein product [Amoebophrya sp. A25]|eukprot:GSA25T00024681001.1
MDKISRGSHVGEIHSKGLRVAQDRNPHTSNHRGTHVSTQSFKLNTAVPGHARKRASGQLQLQGSASEWFKIHQEGHPASSSHLGQSFVNRHSTRPIPPKAGVMAATRASPRPSGLAATHLDGGDREVVQLKNDKQDHAHFERFSPRFWKHCAGNGPAPPAKPVQYEPRTSNRASDWAPGSSGTFNPPERTTAAPRKSDADNNGQAFAANRRAGSSYSAQFQSPRGGPLDRPAVDASGPGEEETTNRFARRSLAEQSPRFPPNKQSSGSSPAKRSPEKRSSAMRPSSSSSNYTTSFLASSVGGTANKSGAAGAAPSHETSRRGSSGNIAAANDAPAAGERGGPPAAGVRTSMTRVDRSPTFRSSGNWIHHSDAPQKSPRLRHTDNTRNSRPEARATVVPPGGRHFDPNEGRRVVVSPAKANKMQKNFVGVQDNLEKTGKKCLFENHEAPKLHEVQSMIKRVSSSYLSGGPQPQAADVSAHHQERLARREQKHTDAVASRMDRHSRHMMTSASEGVVAAVGHSRFSDHARATDIHGGDLFIYDSNTLAKSAGRRRASQCVVLAEQAGQSPRLNPAVQESKSRLRNPGMFHPERGSMSTSIFPSVRTVESVGGK